MELDKKQLRRTQVDELARVEVGEQVAVAERAVKSAMALLSSTSSAREEMWYFGGEPVQMPRGGLSVLLSDICDRAYSQAPILKSELINRNKLSSAVASARMRLLDRMLTSACQPHLGIDGTPPERTIYISLFQASGLHREDAQGRLGFGPPDSGDPLRWRHIWNRIVDQFNSGEAITFAALMDDLAKVPYGLRAGPALLVITAFVLAVRDNVAVMERNSFQPELTIAHFMRLAKNPGYFTIKSLREDEKLSGLVQLLATRLQVIGECQPTLAGISEKLFAWYNALPPYALKTMSVSATAIAVRDVLRRATEPSSLFFRELPVACNVFGKDGLSEIEKFVESLNNALFELNQAPRILRSQATTSMLHAFGATNLDSLLKHINVDYEPHRLELVDHQLKVFLDRATHSEAEPDRWLDGIAGHLTGQRLNNWTDETLDKFDYEIHVISGKLGKWLALARTPQDRNADLRSVHVVSTDGKEEVVVVRLDRPNPLLATRLHAMRKMLKNDPDALEVLGQLLAEYADNHVNDHEAEKRVRV